MNPFRKDRWLSRDGGTSIEYSVLSCLVAVMLIPILTIIGGRLSQTFYASVLDVFTVASGGV